MTDNRQWILRSRPEGEIEAGHLGLVTTPLRPLAEGEVLCRTIYLSLDPTNRIWMSDRDQYLPPVGIGDVMRGGVLSVVEESRSPKVKVGSIVIRRSADGPTMSSRRTIWCARCRTSPACR